MPYFCNNTDTEGSFAYAALQSCFTKRGVSVVKYKPMFAFFFQFVLVWIFVCLFLFLSRSISLSLSLSLFFFQHCCMEQDKLRFFSSCLLLFLGEKKRTRVLVFFFFLLGIAGTKRCAEAAPILAVPGRRMVEGGRDQESFQALLTLEMRIAHVCLLNQKVEKAGCQFATLLQ